MNDALNHVVRFEFRIVNPRPPFLFNYFCVKFGLVKVKFIEAVGLKLVSQMNVAFIPEQKQIIGIR